MVEQTSVTDEDVGSAEAWLRREIQGKKALENAAKVLETLRYAKAQLPVLSKEIAELKSERTSEAAEIDKLVVERKKLAGDLQADRIKHQEAASAAVEAYRKQELDKVEGELSVKKNELTVVSGKVNEHRQTISRQLQQITQVSQELEEIRKEHGALVEVFNKASEVFGSR